MVVIRGVAREGVIQKTDKNGKVKQKKNCKNTCKSLKNFENMPKINKPLIKTLNQ